MKKLKHFHPIKRWRSWSIDAKVWSTVLLLTLSIGGLFGWSQYQDWRNEQFLRDIVADFDRLEAELENALGIEVEDKSGCFTTSEKFSEGKTACFARLEHESMNDSLNSHQVNESLVSSGLFKDRSQFRSGGYIFYYSDWKCTEGVSNLGFYTECPIPVRGANKDLVKELF